MKNNKEYAKYLAAVKEDGEALKLVSEELKTEEMCLAAVQENGYALEYVPEKFKTEEIHLIATQ